MHLDWYSPGARTRTRRAHPRRTCNWKPSYSCSPSRRIYTSTLSGRPGKALPVRRSSSRQLPLRTRFGEHRSKCVWARRATTRTAFVIRRLGVVAVVRQVERAKRLLACLRRLVRNEVLRETRGVAAHLHTTTDGKETEDTYEVHHLPDRFSG